MKTERAQLIAQLEQEMVANTRWVRIHAAEGLLDHDLSRDKVLRLFQPEAETATAPYRIGVWRVLARASEGATRDQYIARIRAVMRDPQATDRLTAAESLAKLHAASRADRELIRDWLKETDDATAPFPRWLLVLSSLAHERALEEAALARLVHSADPIARLRAAFALGRLSSPSEDSMEALHRQLAEEPRDSIARVYLITALLLHETDEAEQDRLEKELQPYANGKANEQLEFGIALGLHGKKEGLALLAPLLDHPEPDARIGAANGMLRLLR